MSQGNDTDFHQHLRRRTLEEGGELLIEKARKRGGGLVSLTAEDNINIMCDVMNYTNLYLNAARGFRYNGITNKLDGSEDSLICREAGTFWRELDMRAKVNEEMKRIERRYKSGQLLDSQDGQIPHNPVQKAGPT